MWMSVQSRNRARTVLSARTLEVDISALVLEIGLEENTAMKVCLSIIYNSTDGFDKTGEAGELHPSELVQTDFTY